jgi:hypothetical protein
MRAALAVLLAVLGTALALWLAFGASGDPGRRVEIGPDAGASTPEDVHPALKVPDPGRQAIPDEPGDPTPPDDPGRRTGAFGRIVDTEGAPIVGAQVFHGPDSALSNVEGRFAFAREPATPTDLIAAARGHAPARVEALRAGSGQALEIVLPEALSITGVVVDADGAPWPDVRVELVDGTPCDATPVEDDGRSPVPGLEAEALASEAESDVTTDHEGRFVLGGLMQRSYLLRFHALGLSLPEELQTAAGASIVVHLSIPNPGPPLDGLGRGQLERRRQE